jgi:phospho-N-acetylmuramoyl-pentapeptide-transferase
LGFAWLGHVAAKLPVEVTLTRTEGFGVTLPTWLWAIFVVLLIVGSTNAVNLTDGLDGLAAGSAAFGASAFVVIGFWQFRHVPVYEIPQALDLAILAAALMGGCIGFLWWNAAPAQIFMGDTGALAIGAGLAGLSLATGTPLLLAVVGGLFMAETLSVIVQVIAFRVFKRRLFRMTPIHHHFEHLDPPWPETTIIIRFWIIAGALTAGALGVFYYDYLRECPGTPGARNCSSINAQPEVPPQTERAPSP